MDINTFKKYEYTVENLAFGMVPQDVLIKELSSGRLCGVLLEADIAFRFGNLTKEGCGQGYGEDLRLITTDGIKTVQAKTVQTKKALKGRVNNKVVDSTAVIGWTTKSGLWDSRRGIKRDAIEWDQEHDAYMKKYDYFLYINIDSFPTVSIVLVPAAALSNRPEAKTQAQDYHFGKSKKRVAVCEAPQWQYPISITRGMWDEFVGNESIEV